MCKLDQPFFSRSRIALTTLLGVRYKKSHLVRTSSQDTIRALTNIRVSVRLVAMVLPTVMFYFGGVYLSLDILRACGFRAPFRISSTPKGAVMPTALYVLIEDVVAVDGGGGQMYRYALRTRYLSSPYFRRMLVQMNFFWAGGSIVWGAAITAMVFTTPQDAAFAVCLYSSPRCVPT